MPDLGAEVDLKPRDHIDRLASDHLRVERVPGLLKVGDEHHVIDVTDGVGITPPDVDLTFKDLGHSRTPDRLEAGSDDAAVDLIYGAGDVGSPLRCQEGDEVAEFDRLAE